MLTAKGEKYESLDHSKAVKRLAEIKLTLDPDATLLSIPSER